MLTTAPLEILPPPPPPPPLPPPIPTPHPVSSSERSEESTPSGVSNNTTPHSSILNLSSHVLTPSQKEALELGLKFAPSPKEEPDLLEFFDKFEQSCSWAFKRITGGQIPTLPTQMLQRLELMKNRLDSLEHHSYPSNITPDVRRAILQLQNMKNLVIRQADKGSCTVILNRDTYIQEGLQHLADTNIYSPSAEDKTEEIAHKANWAISHYNNLKVISNYQKNQLLTDVTTVRTQQLYFLNKVHKHPHKLRPIVSASSGPTEKISGLLTKLLAPHLEDISSLVKNSIAVVNILEDLNVLAYPDLLLVSFDVQALYPSIPQGPGIEMALQRCCPTAPPTSREVPFKNMMRDLLRIILGDNHFKFNNSHYTQKSGVAMGTKCAPHLANLFMTSLEEKALLSWQGTQPLKWMRFIDDILMVWTGSATELVSFRDHLNSQMSSIKFSMEASTDSVTFLDLKIYKGSNFWNHGRLDTSLYIKDTNPQCFLHYSSCHPFTTFKTVLRGEIIRALRCTSSQTVFTTILEKLLQKFRERGYPKWLLREEAENVPYSKRRELLHPPERRTLEQDVTLFSSIFTPSVSSSSIRRALEDEETPFAPMVLRPRPTSIQDKIVRAKVQQPRKNQHHEDTG